MKNDALLAARTAAVPRGIGTLHPIFAERALNAEIWDVEGRRFIDFASGIAVNNTGHMHPRVTEAVQQQLGCFSHACFQVMGYDVYVRLAERLNALAPGSAPKKTIFLTTGAEAVENAVKIARAHTGRPGVIAFSGGFHGRTMMGLALTGKVNPYKLGFGPYPADVHHLPFPADFHGVSEDAALAALDRVFAADIDSSQIAAIIIEPVQGEGGFYAASPAFMRRLRAICDQTGCLLIADEIQTGFARTGKTFAIEHAGIEPDLITVAKGLAGGFPLSGVIGRAEIMDAPQIGGLGGTFGGSPIACAAAHAVLDVIEEEDLNRRAVEIGEQIRRWAQLQRQRPGSLIGEVRGLGSMVALEFVEGNNPDRPAAAYTKAVVHQAMKLGLITLSCGVRSNVLRFLPPLTIEDEILSEGLSLLSQALENAHPQPGLS